ncbi:hypothetical protein PVA38_11175 [Streptococcus pneumoniae D39]|nr:hypothetical protein PVA38_11175 [Streptococcus pneumoniae D39]
MATVCSDRCCECSCIGCWGAVSYTHLRAHETVLDLVCRLLLEKKKSSYITQLPSATSYSHVPYTDFSPYSLVQTIVVLISAKKDEGGFKCQVNDG